MEKVNLVKIKYIAGLFLPLFFFIVGCTGISTESNMMKDLEGVNMTSIELGIHLNEFGRYFAGTVEEAADEIISKTKNNSVKQNALQWKINIIPQALESLVILDPVAAGIDLYALSIQMNHFFTMGNGKDLFGEQQNIAIKASENILREMRLISDEFRSPAMREKTEQTLQNWTAENPIENINFNRRSTFGVLAKALGSQNYNLGETVGSIAEGVYDIRRQITIYTDFVPKQVKWQLQLSAYQLVTDSLVEKSFNNFDRIIRSIERITSVAEETPELIKEIQLSTLKEINKQLIITLNILSNEREIILTSLTSERIAVLENIDKQRIASFDNLEQLTNGAINKSSVFASDIIDKIFIMVLILLVIVFVGLIFFVRVWRIKTP